MTKRKQTRSLGGTLTLSFFLILIGLFMVLPFVYAVASSFKPPTEFFLFPPPFFPINPVFDNYKDLSVVLSNMWVPFERYVFNSTVIAAITSVVYLFIAAMSAFPLAKHDFPGKKVFLSVITLALMFTPAITGIPQYVVMTQLDLIDNMWGVILPALSSTLGVYLCINYLEIIPDTILESARIDGANEIRVWWSIIMPNIKPSLFTMLIFEFQAIWMSSGGNVLYSEQYKTLPAALGQVATAGIARAGVGSAASVIMMIPPLVIFIISQTNVIDTMTHSGIKG
jgi:putative chitobiose transport system permease protein